MGASRAQVWAPGAKRNMSVRLEAPNDRSPEKRGFTVWG